MVKEVKVDMHPEAQNFVSQFYELRDQHTLVCDENDRLKATIKAMETDFKSQLGSANDMINSYIEANDNLARERDYYMRLCTEQQTHFKAIQSLTVEADKCFKSAPYRNNGAPPTQPISHEQSQQLEEAVKQIPKFLQNGPLVEKEWK